MKLEQTASGLKKILVVEPNADGHRLSYVGIICRFAKENDIQISMMTTEEVPKSAEWGLHIASLDQHITLIYSRNFSLAFLSGDEAVDNADRVLFLDADKYLPSIVRGRWKSRTPASFLVMRPDGEPRNFPGAGRLFGVIKKTLMLLSNRKKYIRVVGLRSAVSPRKGPLLWVADPVSLSESSQQQKSISKKLTSFQVDYWVGTFGYISARKNLQLILEAVDKTPGVGLLIAGTIDQTERDKCSSLMGALARQGRLVYIPGPLEEETLDSAISTVHCVIAAHSNEGPSGLVAKGASAGKHLLLAGAKNFRKDAINIGSSAKWTRLDAQELSNAIKEFQSQPLPLKIKFPQESVFAESLL